MISLKQILEKKMRNSPLGAEAARGVLLDECNQWLRNQFGRDSASRIRAVYIRNHMVHIAVLHSAFGQQLRFMEKNFLHAVNVKYGSKMLVGVRYML